ncbi:MAG: PHP domain-containing protein [Culicoidibacterales bacterium]
MKIDFHTHGKLAKKLPFSEVYTQWLLQAAKKSGLDAICLTEHFNTLEFDVLYEYVTKYCHCEGDSYVTPENLRIFLGLEVDIQEGGHTLILGNKETVLRLHKQLVPYQVKGGFLPIDTLYTMIKDEAVIFGAAHPYRPGSNIPQLSEQQLMYFDFFDLNGKDLAKNSGDTQKDVYALAKRLNKPCVGGSDTHQATQYGVVWNRFSREITTINELYQEMKAMQYIIEIAPTIEMQVENASAQKKLLKYIHELGGAYDTALLSE